MVIDIDSYVDRYVNTYIFYNGKNFDQKYGDLSRATSWFLNEYNEAVGRLKCNSLEAQTQAIVKNMIAGAKDAEQAYEIEQLLQNGTLLEDTLDSIAQVLDRHINSYYDSTDFITVLQDSQTYKGMLDQSNYPSAQKVNDFFNLIQQAIQKANIQTHGSFIQDLQALGPYFTGQKTGEQKLIFRQNSELTQSERIINDLRRAANLMQKTGRLSSKSFSSTITDIFSTVAGESVARAALSSTVSEAIDDVDQMLLSRIKGLKFTEGGSTELGGRARISQNRTSKVDIFSNGSFQLTVTLQNGQSIDIEIGTNLSAKNYASNITSQSQIDIVSRTPLSRYFADGSERQYLAYNIMAHKNEGSSWDDGFRTLRASISANYFNDWLSGSGDLATQGAQSLGIDRAQFILFNGRVVSVMRVINSICDQYIKTNGDFRSENMPVTVHYNGVKNIWVGDQEEKSLNLALIRSRLAKETINALTIDASFSYGIIENILKTYPTI